MEIAEKNSEFSSKLAGFGKELGLSGAYFTKKLHINVWELAEKNGGFAINFGYGTGKNLSSELKESRGSIWNKIEDNSNFAFGVGYGIRERVEKEEKDLPAYIAK